MPKRSNEFQRLVTVLMTHIAEGGFVVAESDMVRDERADEDREIDITIRQAGFELRLAVECTSARRPADIKWIDEMYGKHHTLGTDRLILASRAGFRQPARKKAKALGIETVSLEEAAEDAARRIVRGLRVLWAKVFSAAAETIRVDLTTPTGPMTMSCPVSLAGQEIAIFDPDGKELGSLQDIVKMLSQQPNLFRDVVRDARGDEKFFEIGLRLGEILGPVFLRHEETGGAMHTIDTVRIHGRCTVNVSEVPLSHGQLAGNPVAWGRARMAEHAKMVVLTEKAGMTRTSLVEDPEIKGGRGAATYHGPPQFVCITDRPGGPDSPGVTTPSTDPRR
jgi:hypothetical protein